MTEALNNFPESDPSYLVPSVQCSLCLHEIVLPFQLTEETSKGYVKCPRCEYNQPTTKKPRSRDMVVFSVTIGVVYLTTIVAVLLSR